MLKVIFLVVRFLLSVVDSFVIPVWSDNYHVRGTLYVPDAKVVEPFEVWYSKSLNKSRVDFYDGMVRTYQMLTSSGRGISYKVVPYTSETQWNVRKCFKQIGDENEPVELQPALYPIEDIFDYSGDVSIGSTETIQQWARYEYINDDSLTYFFYTKCVKNNCNWPVRLEMNGTNLIFPAHAGYYYINYELYEPDVVSSKIFDFRQSKKCKDLALIDSESSFNTLSAFLPGISRIVREDRGFRRFTRKFGTRFENKNQLRDLLTQFRQDMREFKADLKKAIVNFIKFKRFDLAPIDVYGVTKEKKEAENDFNQFTYTENDLKMLKKYRYFNLAKMGAMQPIQSQVNCGSCWAFSTTAALEGAYYVKHKKSIKLAEQALIDCSWGFGNYGCDGGLGIYALDWIQAHGGLPSRKSYGSYKANDAYCLKQNRTERVRVRKYEWIETGDFKAIQIALIKNGPIITGMSASYISISFYKRGVYNHPECSSDPDTLDHSVAIVGFGYHKNKLYWIIRNSWSTLWGINGYGYIAADNNICGLSSLPIVPYVY